MPCLLFDAYEFGVSVRSDGSSSSQDREGEVEAERGVDEVPLLLLRELDEHLRVEVPQRPVGSAHQCDRIESPDIFRNCPKVAKCASAFGRSVNFIKLPEVKYP